MSPRTALAAAFRASLSLDRYGEDVTYFPAAGGAAAAVRARINQSMRPNVDGDVDGRQDSLRVAFCNDPAAVDAAGLPLGGVERPGRGDSLCRSGLGDGVDVRYAFEGTVFQHSDHHWDLEFVRVELQRVGLTGR